MTHTRNHAADRDKPHSIVQNTTGTGNVTLKFMNLIVEQAAN